MKKIYEKYPKTPKKPISLRHEYIFPRRGCLIPKEIYNKYIQKE